MGPPPLAGAALRDEPVAPASPHQVSASEEYLSYGQLRMPGANEPGRGRLRPEPRANRYLELLSEARISTDFDVVSVVEEAVYEARELEYIDPPERCTFAWSSRFDYAYPAGAEATIASDGIFRTVPVSQSQTKASVGHVTVPRAGADVYRVATMHNPLDAPLLPGPVDVYLGSNFVASTDLDMTPRGAQVELGLGIEQQIKVARNTRFGSDSSGILGQSRSLRHEIRIDVENLLPRPADVEVRERVPVIAEDEEDIKVVVGKVLPDWHDYKPFPATAADDPLRGGHRWTVRLAAGERQELRVHYEIRIASKHELVGGNRREQ